MGLADELARSNDLLSSKAYQKCGVSLLWDTLDPEDREALRSLLDAPNVLGTKILGFLRHYAETLEGNDDVQSQRQRALCLGLSAGTIQRHRRGACSCGGLS